MLTAGHCLASAGVGYNSDVNFAPGMTGSATTISLPYGVWEASNWFVPNSWRFNGEPAEDWGIIEIAPRNGQFIGDVVGSYMIRTSLPWPANARVYPMGYPQSGFWSTADGLNGHAQYACDTTYDGWVYIGSGSELWADCSMNRGASGGPWLVPLTDGSWVVGGVNNRCDGFYVSPTQYCDPYSTDMRSSFMNERFLEFWNAVLPSLRW